MPSILKNRSALIYFEKRDAGPQNKPAQQERSDAVWSEKQLYTPEEDALILRSYRTLGSHELARKLGRPYRSIQYRYRTLRLRCENAA